MRIVRWMVCLAVANAWTAGGLAAQSEGAYLDATAAALHAAASNAWREIDESVVRYTAMVQQRIAARLRTPLKDRTLYRSEAAARVFWDRDHETLTQVLASNAEYPGREYAVAEEGFDLRLRLPGLAAAEAVAAARVTPAPPYIYIYI